MQKIRVVVLSIFTLAVAAIVVFVVIAKRPPQYYVRRGIVFGTNVKIAYATRKKNAKFVVDAMFDELRKLNAIFNPYEPGTDLYKLNHSNGKWMKVNSQLLSVLKYSINFAKETGGEFDPTLGKIIALWGFNTDDPRKWRMPTPAEISNALKHVGYMNVEFKGNEVRLLNGVWVDLEGIVKGYAVDALLAMAKANDEKSTGYVDVGGDIGIIGPKYGKQPWKISIQNPRGMPNSDISYVYLYKGSIATSGDHEKYVIVNGKRYYHTLNPKTGYPSDYFKSVTAISRDEVLSNAFDMAAMVGGPSKIEKWASEFGVAYMAVNENGKILTNSLWKDYENP